MTGHRRNAPSGNRNFKEGLAGVYNFILRHSKIVFPLILIVCVAMTVMVALNAGKAKDVSAEEASGTTVSDANAVEAETGLSVTEEEFQNNAYPDVNALIMDYYNAVADGDVDKALTISNSVSETERIRIREMSPYIESYPVVEIYTKPGPDAGSYIAYVYYKVKFGGYDNLAPGIQTFYICTAEDGSLYMNEGAGDAYVIDYITQVNMQDDVVELYNKVTVEYNELVASDPNLSLFLQELGTQMDVLVGEALANAEAAGKLEEEQGAGDSEEEGTPADTVPEQNPETEQPQGPVQARTTTTINVRSSDSETADRLGKLSAGTQIEVLEARANGWSRISYEGKDAYVKSEYLEMAQDASQAETIGTVTATDNVNVRADASEAASKLGIIYQGESLDLVEKQDNGWSKVIYEGQIGYVKSEYLE